MKTKKLIIMLMLAVPAAMYAHHDCNPNDRLEQSATKHHMDARQCPNCGEEMKQYQKMVNRLDKSRKCRGCNGHGRQANFVNGRIVYNGPMCKACDGTGHPYKQVFVSYWKCHNCGCQCQ